MIDQNTERRALLQGCAEPDSAYIRMVNLTKQYQEGGLNHWVLKGVSLELCQGETAAILGKSGSGKTTLLNLISGIDRADEGEIYLDGQNLTRMDDHQRTLFRRLKIGFVFQFFNLIPTLTVWENVTLPLELSRKFTPTGRKAALDLLEDVGLESRLKTYPDRLSGGEQQRVAIARALVHNPVLVLADEPTGNLDDATGQSTLVLLDRLTRKQGRNLIIVTHSREAAAVADRILYLRDGKLIEGE